MRKKSSLIYSFLRSAFGVFLAVSVTYADQTFTVTNSADSGEGSLRWAMTEPCTGVRTVNFGFYDTEIELSSSIVVTGNVAIVGQEHGYCGQFQNGGRITISGGGAVRPFVVSPGGTFRLQGLTVANGNADEGGAIYNDGGDLRVVRCTLLGNSAMHGGAVYNNGGSSVLNTCTLSGNTAVRGGVVYSDDGFARLQYVTACENSASELGGVLYTDGGSNIVHRSILWDNDAPACTTAPAYSTQIADANSATVSVTQCIIQGGYPGYYDSTDLGIDGSAEDVFHEMPYNLDVDPLLGPLGYPRYSGDWQFGVSEPVRVNTSPVSTMMYEPLPGSPAHFAIYGFYDNDDWLEDPDDVYEQRGSWLRRHVAGGNYVIGASIGSCFIGFQNPYIIGEHPHYELETNYWGEAMWETNTSQSTDVLTPFKPITMTVTSPYCPPISYEGGEVFFEIPDDPTGPSCTISPNPAKIAADGTVTFTPVANGYVGTFTVIAHVLYHPPYYDYLAGKKITLSNTPSQHLIVTNEAEDDQFGSLRWATENVDEGGRITFAGDLTCPLTRNPRVLYDIDGEDNDIVITAQGKNTVMTVGRGGSPFPITIQNVTIADGFFDVDYSYQAGGAYIRNGDISFINVKFLNNRGYNGGAMSVDTISHFDGELNLKLINCVFDGNHARTKGGAFYLVDADAEIDLINCTFTKNEATTGGAIYNQNPGFFVMPDGMRQRFSNCIFWDNVATNYPTIHTEAGGGSNSVTFTSCDIQNALSDGTWDTTLGMDGGGNMDVDPLFVDALGPDGIYGNVDDDVRLRLDSPLIDAGDNDLVPTNIIEDLAQNERFFDLVYRTDTGAGTAPIVDLGAYEYVNTAPGLNDVEYALAPIAENEFDNNGTLVADILGASGIIDPDADAQAGMAITAADSAFGEWSYSLDGTNWTALGSVSTASARLLRADDATRLRFVPDLYWNGEASVTFQAWDGAFGANGGLADASAAGGTTAFSTNAATASTTVVPVDQAPVIGEIANQFIDEGYSTPAITLSITDVDTPADAWVLSATASDTNLVPIANIVFGGAGTNRTVTVTPASYQSGEAQVGIIVSDGELSTTNIFTLMVLPVNNAPTIDPIDDQSVQENGTTTPIPFTIHDVDTPLGSLSVSGFSDNPTLVPPTGGAIVFGGSDSNRTVTIAPAAGHFGTARMNIIVSDGQYYHTAMFTLTVTPVNTAPVIGAIPDQNVDQDKSTAPRLFSVSDRESAAGTLMLTGSSDNTTLVPDANIVFGGSGGARTVTVTPAPGQYGTATITVTASDGELSSERSFTLTVNHVNQAPVVSEIPDLNILQNGSSVAVAFTITDAETAPSSLTLFKATDNSTLIPYSGITLGGSGGNRTVTITPATGQHGSGSVTISVSDGDRTTVRQFGVTVNAVNQAPSISYIANQTLAENNATKTLSVVVSDVDTPVANLTLSGSADNTTLVPSTAFAFGGSDANRTVTVTPAANQFGTATVTITVSDGERTGTSSFTLTVTPVNTAPTIGVITNQTMLQDGTPPVIDFVIGDRESQSSELILFARSGNESLAPASGIVFGGSDSNRTVTVTPATNQSGTAAITIWVYDGVLSTPGTFNFTVTPVNKAPTIGTIADQSLSEDTPSGAVWFWIDDREDPGTNLTLTAVSSDPVLIPPANIVFGGAPYYRNLTVSPGSNQSGTGTVTVTVSDGALSNSTAFTVSVAPVNDAPVIGTVADQTIDQNAATGAIPFAIGDAETAASDLLVTAISGNLTLLPATNMVLGGTGTNRTITLTPAAQQYGVASVDVTVSDGDLSTTGRFTLVVNQVNQAPFLSAFADQEILQETATAAIPFTVGDLESDPGSLIVSAVSDNPALTPASAFTFGGSGSNRTVTVTPERYRNGTAEIGMVVSDGERTATNTFTLTVVAVDYAPIVSSFNHPETSVGLDVAITLFEAWDDTGVTGYMITTDDTPPSYDDPAWSDVPPSSFSVPAVGTYVPYPWVKDGSGNVSASYGVVYEVNVVNNVLYVQPNGLTNGLCDSWANAGDLQYALSYFVDTGYEIWAKAGTYTPRDGDGNPTRNATFYLMDGKALYGGFAGAETNRSDRDPQANVTVLSGDLNGDDGAGFANRGDNALHVVTLSGGRIDGVTITAGQADGSDSESIGGGILISGGVAPVVNNVCLTDNYAVNGGGLYAEFGAAPILSDVSFEGNAAAAAGGGLYAGTDASPLLCGVTFSTNIAGTAGGMMVENGSAKARLANVTFCGNQATNTDSFAAGGLLVGSGIAALTNCTFSGNDSASTAFISAGGIGSGMGGTVHIGNTIVAGNTSASGNPDVSGFGFLSEGHNLIGLDDDEIGGLTPGQNDLIGTNATPIDARLEPLADNHGLTKTMAILPDSPARDAGDDALAPETDQRGVVRPQGPQCDIGAYELDYAVITLTSSVNPSRYAQEVTFTAHVAPEWATGTVTFAEGETVLASNVTLTAGVATFEISDLSTGPHAIVASYAGNSAVIGGESTSFTQQVVKASQSIGSVVVTPATLQPGESATLTANSSSGLPVQFSSLTPDICTVSGTTVVAVATGVGVIAADQSGDGNYNPALRVSKSIGVGKALASVTLGDLIQTFDGTARNATATTDPEGRTVLFTYTGIDGTSYGPSFIAPIGAGTYEVVGTISDSAVQGSASGTLVVAKALASITLDNLEQTYTGIGKSPSYSTVPAGLAVGFTYNGSSVAPCNTGTYAVTGTVSDVNYEGTTYGNLSIFRAEARIVLSNLSHTYDGTAKSATAVTTPAGLAVAMTYDGSSSAPANAGVYTVSATVSDANYSGNVDGSLVITKASQTITFDTPPVMVVGSVTGLVASAGSGSPVVFTSLDRSIGFVAGTNVFALGAGTCSIAADQAGTDNYLAAPRVTRSYTVEHGSPVVGPVTLERYSGESLKFLLSRLLENSNDPEGSALSVSAVAGTTDNSGTVTTNGAWGYYTPPENDLTDYFTFTVKNAYGKSTDGTAEILVMTAELPDGVTLNYIGANTGASGIVLKFVGIPGRSYTLQSCTDLGNPVWENRETKITGVTGLFEYTDTYEGATRFYRLVPSVLLD